MSDKYEIYDDAGRIIGSFKKPTITTRAKPKPSLKGVEPLKINENKRTIQEFRESVERSQFNRQQEEKARQAAEYLRVNHAYETIKKRQELERAEKERARAIANHLQEMDEIEAEADDNKIRYMKIMLGGFMATLGIIQLLLGGSLWRR